MLVLALETSTSSAKALVYDSKLGLIAAASERFEADIAKVGQQDPVGVHLAMLRVAHLVAKDRDIRAIALSSTWHSVGICDAAMQPISPVYTWEFSRAASFSEEMRKDDELTETLYRSTGCMPNVTYPRQTLLYLKKEGLSLAGRQIISQGGYSFWRMTGEWAETVNIQSGGGFIHLASRRYDPFVLRMLGVGERQFGTLVTYRDTAPLNEEAARAIGVQPGIPVVPAHSDGACNQIGSGCGLAHRMTLSVGTSGAMRMATEVPVFAENRETWCYCGVDGYLGGAAVAGACNCIDWFAYEMMQGRLSHEQMEGERTPPLLDPPVFLPFIFGERCPGWRDDRRAGFVEIAGTHDFRDLYFSLQMGVLFGLLQCYEPMADILGEPERIVVSGGILNSARWSRMLADIFAHPMQLVRNKDASLIGAAVLALHAVGACGDIRQFHQEMDETKEIKPDPALAPWYREQYARYMNWYAKS